MATAKTSVPAPSPRAAPGKALQSLDVSILDRDYKIACQDGEKDSLLVAVAYLDAKMREIRTAGKIAGTDRIAVMAALNIAHELLMTKTPAGFDIGEYKRTISGMHSQIDEAIASQEKLF